MKKVLLLLLTVAMLFSLAALGAAAADDDPALLITASQLGSAGNAYFNEVGHELLEEDGATFVRFTAKAADPWVLIQPTPTTDVANKYAAIKYRTTVNNTTASLYAKVAEPHVDVALNGDGEWHIAVVDISNGGTNDKWVGEFNRLDPLNVDSGSADYAWIALFADEAKAAAYTGPKVELVRVNSYNNPGGIGVWVGKSGSHNPKAAVAFNAASGFASIGLPIYWASNGSNAPYITLNVNLYAYDTDIATSLAGTPVFTKTLNPTKDESAGVEIDLGKIFSAGEYVLAFEAASDQGYFVLPDGASAYSSVRMQFTPSSFGFYVNFVKADVDSYFDRLSTCEGQIEVIEGNLCPRGGDAIDLLGSGDFGIRLNVDADHVLKSVTGLASPTWNNNGDGSNAEAKIYAWNTDYETSVAGEVLATASVLNHKDNQNLVFNFDNKVNGDLLIVISATGENKVGFWCSGDKGAATTVFLKGAETNHCPGTNYAVEAVGQTMTSLDRVYIDYDALSFTEPDYAGTDVITIKKGQTINILGWAANSMASLKRVYWTLDGVEKACSDNYRPRGDLSAHTGYSAAYLGNSGFGLDDNLMELTDINKVAKKTTAQVQIIAEFENGVSCVLKEFTLVVKGDVQQSIDAVAVNEDAYPVSTNYNEATDITINVGDKVNILGWVAKYGANVEKIVWQYIAAEGVAFDDEGVEIVTMECSDTYREREAIADIIGVPAQYLGNSGFGHDEDLMELVGIGNLDPGVYTVRIRAVFDDGTEGKVKAKFTLRVQEVPVATVIVDGTETKVQPDAVAGVTLTSEDGKLVVTSAADAADPWVSIPLDNIDAGVYTSFTVKYSIDGAMHANNVYLRDTAVNPGYSGVAGTWAGPGMDGATEKTFSIRTQFTTMLGTKLTGIRFPGAAAGGKLVIESITFNKSEEFTYGDVIDFDDADAYGMSFDGFWWSGGNLGAGRAMIDYFGNPSGAMHADHFGYNGTSTGYNGWVAFKQKVVAFGYMINGEIVLDKAFIMANEPTLAPTVDAWDGWAGSGETVQRYYIVVPFNGLSGVNDIMAVALLEDGTVVKLNSKAIHDRDTEVYMLFNDAYDFFDANDSLSTGWWTNPFNKTTTATITFTADGWFNGFETFIYASNAAAPVHVTMTDAEGNVVLEKDFTMAGNFLYTFFEPDAAYAPGEYTLVFDGCNISDDIETWFVLGSGNATEGKRISATGSTDAASTLASPFFRLIKTSEPETEAVLEAEISDGKIVINVTGKFGEKDWIGVYKSGETPGDTASILYFYVDAEGGTYTLPVDGQVVNRPDELFDAEGNLIAGDYVVYLFANDGYELVNGTEGVELTVEEVVPPTTGGPDNPQTGDAAMFAFAAIAVVALGAAVVLRKKRVKA